MNVGPADPGAYIRIFWRWKFLFLAFVVLVPLIAYFVVSRQAKVYRSSVLVQEGALPVDTSLFSSGGAPAPGIAPNAETLAGDARIIETPGVARLAAAFMKPPTSDVNLLLGSISASADTTTGFITISSSSSDPKRAAAVANAFGSAVVRLRSQQAIGILTATIDQITAQLNRLGNNDIGRAQLSAQLQRLRALRAAQGSNAEVLQAATPSSSPVSPNPGRAVSLGLLAGVLLGLGAVFVAEAADRRIRHPEVLEELTGRPLLSVIPRTALGLRPGEGQEREAFHMLRSALMFFNVDRPLSTVMIASPVKGEGKTTVATGLAVALAEGGRDVILIDADLRRPQAASRLGIGEAEQAGRGLSGVLSGQHSLSEELIELQRQEKTGNGTSDSGVGGRLRVLPAGGTPPNPSELLASQRMQALLAEVSDMAELVLIDTNPLLSVSDPLPLFDYTSGVVVVVKLHSTTKDALRRFQKTLANTSASVLGVVATGAVGGIYGRYGYGYGYGYYGYGSTAYANGNGRSGRLGWLRRASSKQKV